MIIIKEWWGTWGWWLGVWGLGGLGFGVFFCGGRGLGSREKKFKFLG
jgi:hypothetical protein